MEIDGKTKSFGIIGNPVGHSLSPLMQNMFLKSVNINGVYIPLEIKEDQLEESIRGLFTAGFAGINVTIPFKEKVIPYLSGISSQAKLMGAVNTLIRRDGGFWGENTDGEGLLKALKEEKQWTPRGKTIVILGAGGSARAVSLSLAFNGAKKIILVNRDLQKAQVISKLVIKEAGIPAAVFGWQDDKIKSAISQAEVLINTTPLGMIPATEQIPPIDINILNPGQLVVDLIYNPQETKLLKLAHNQGCDTYNGLGMLLYQGCLAFELWTGKKPSLEGVKERLESYLGNT